MSVGNKYKEPETLPVHEVEETAAATPTAKKSNRMADTFFSVLDGSFLKRQNAARQITFLFFLAGIAVLYIGNAYYAEKTIRESTKITKDIIQMQGEYISAQSKLAEKTRQSAVATKAAQMGLREAIVPPVKLTITKTKK